MDRSSGRDGWQEDRRTSSTGTAKTKTAGWDGVLVESQSEIQGDVVSTWLLMIVYEGLKRERKEARED